MQLHGDTVSDQVVTFGYDSFNRLTSRTVTSGTVQNYTYSYDRYGNRLTQTCCKRGILSIQPLIRPTTGSRPPVSPTMRQAT
jgi:YD repeat-containing protein